MATSSIPAAIDWLYETIFALPACASPCVVCDGWPDQRGDTGVVIGIVPDDPAALIAPAWAEIGARAQWERYAVPCIVWARRVGQPGGQRPAQAARAAAFEVFDAINSRLRTPSGVTLGGTLNSGTAIVTNVRVEQTADAAASGAGRTCEIRFDVECKHRSEA